MWDVTGSTVKIIGQLGFLLTHPVWDVTMTGGIDVNRLTGFLLTHPVWDVTDFKGTVQACFSISTHTSRVGCDNKLLKMAQSIFDFYSHIPCGM